MKHERFHVVAIRETENYDAATLADMNVREAFGLYLIREGEATYACSLTPSSAARFIGNRFIIVDDADVIEAEHWTVEDKRREAETEGDIGAWEYISYIDVAKFDSRFITHDETVKTKREVREWAADANIPCKTDEEFHNALWECAWSTVEQGGPCEPDILDDDTFNAWEAEQAAKRRAEMRPVLDRDPLPLFAAAFNAMGLNSYQDARSIGWL